jgi:hypothetical protein
VLGLDGGDQIDGFLKARDAFEPCTVEDINRDVATLAQHYGDIIRIVGSFWLAAF